MNIRTTLVTKLDASTAIVALVGTRIYPLRALQNESRTHLVYRVDDTVREIDLGGPAGWGQTRVELTCNADTYTKAWSLAGAVVGALHGWGSNASTEVMDSRVDNELDVFNFDTQRYEVPVDVVVTARTT